MASTVLEHTAFIREHRERQPKASAEIDVAYQLRRLRIKKNLLVRDLARLAGLSTRRLQKIEEGSTSPTVSMLQQLLAVLGVPFSDFLAMEEPGPIDRRVLNPQGAGQGDRFSTYQHRQLSADLSHKKLLPMATTVHKVEPGVPVRWETHEGEAFILVLSGRVTLLTEHYAPAVLSNGDSAYFDCNMRYRLCSEEEAAEIIWLISMT